MIRLTRRAIHHLRHLRGRCPSCNSAGPAQHQCQTCYGYQGPFPVSEETQARWTARFEHRLEPVVGARTARVAKVISATS